MNIHHLELFYYVARHGGISEAVRHMPYGIQQPAISGQVGALEDYLGTTLFHRRPFALTPAGEELFLWEFLRERGLRVIPVMTKADKLKRGERNRQLKLFTGALAPLGVDPGGVIWFSALTREGRDRLWDRLLACLEGA